MLLGCASMLTARALAADPAQLAGRVGLDGGLDARVPTATRFVDEQGQAVGLDGYLGTAPAVLVMAYYRCRNLCNVVLRGMAEGVGMLDLEAGRDFQIIVVSIDPRETPADAAEARAELLSGTPGSADGRAWHFLTGTASASRAVAEAIGFRYAYDPATDQYAHPAGITILTPEGRVSRYLYGVRYAARDLRLGLVEAAGGTIGSATDRLLLLCYHYDPQRGTYGLLVRDVMRFAAVVTALIIAAGLGWLLRRDAAGGRRVRNRS